MMSIVVSIVVPQKRCYASTTNSSCYSSSAIIVVVVGKGRMVMVATRHGPWLVLVGLPAVWFVDFCGCGCGCVVDAAGAPLQQTPYCPTTYRTNGFMSR